MPWFLRNLRKHNTTPIVFANFGVKNVSAIDVDYVIDMTGVREKGWFKKPKSIIDCPSKNTIWLDTDCEVLSNIEQLFDMLVPEKLCMVRDVLGRRKRTHLYNSGVVGVIDKPKTLVILHYNTTRISVPLFKDVTDIADLLYHHISTLEQQVLRNHSDWEKKANRQIVCFQIKKEGGG